MRVPLQLRVEPVEWWNVAILPGSPFFTGLLHFHLLFHPTSSVHVHWILPQLNQKDRWSKRQVFPVVYHGRRVFFFFAKTEVSQFLCISSSFQIWPHPPCVHVGVFLLILYGSCSALSCSHVTRTSNVYQQYLHRQRKKHRTSNTFNRKKKRYIMEHYCSGCFLQGTAEWIICLHVTPTTSSFTKVTSNLLWALLLARQLQVCLKFKNGSKAEHPVKIQK